MTQINSLEIKKEDSINTQRLIIKLKKKLRDNNIECNDVENVQKLFTV